MSVSHLIRENIRNLVPFRSARSEFAGKADVFLDANESPFENGINRYPDPYQVQVKERLAQSNDIKVSEIILGNGSDELIDLIVRTFCVPGRDIVRFPDPSFGMYEVIADINDVGKERVALNDDFTLNIDQCVSNQSEHHKLLFLCTPNNPTGNSLTKDSILKVLDKWQGIVVVDEAYIQFSNETSLISELKKYPRLIILQTLSKAAGAAGLRLGMGYASSEIISYLNKIKPPYNVNTHTQEKALSLLDQTEQINRQIASIVAQRDELYLSLQDITGITKVYPSSTNFLLVRCEQHNELYDYLTGRELLLGTEAI